MMSEKGRPPEVKRKEERGQRYKFRLFVTGATPNSIRAIANIKNICENYLKGNYSLEIVDLYERQDLAEIDQLVAVPMLLKSDPTPLRKLIGDLSNTDKVLKALGLKK